MSQELVGKVTDSDSAATALYQAEVTQSQGGKVIATYKTYFDGSYHLKVKPNQAYQIKATYGGRRDSTVTISVDKNGMLISGTLVLSLYKNGLRLMGYVLDREEDLPIKEAGILIRNVMTRKEDKYFTDVNGYYNLKMDFETNYTFKIDKRSPGIINKYQDTSFNISTIGFNQPLDFRFDIKLGPAEGFTKARPQYDPYAAPDNKNLKPVVQVVGKKDSLKQHDKETALAELDKKLNSKDSAIASINKKLEDINQAKKEEKTALNTDDQGKKKEDDAKLKAEHDKQAEAKRKELEKAEAAIKAKQLAENNQKEKEAADKLRKEQEDAALAKLEKERKEKLTAEKTQKGKEATDKLRKEQEDAAVAKLEKERIEKLTTEKTQKAKEAADKLRKEQEDAAGAKLEKERIEKLTAEKTQKEKEAADKLRKEQEDAAVAKLEKERKEKLTAEKTQKEKEAADKLRKQQEDAALVKLEKERKEKLATDKKKEADAILAKQQEEHPYQTQQDKAKIDKETAALNRADSMLLADKQRKEKNGKVTAAKQSVETQKMDPSVTVIPSDSVMTDKQRKEQRDRDLVKMKRAREEAEARMLVEKRDKEAKEKMAKKESKRLAKELAEQSKLRKKSEEQARKLTEDQQRITAKKVQAETEQRELEAKRAHEEQEKKNLISQREKLLSNQQVRVARDDNQEPYNNSEKAVQEGNQKKAIADYQRKIKDDAVSSPDVVNLNTARPASVKVIKTRGYVKNGQTEDPLSNVSINIRRLNGIVSQEVASDNNGNYQFSVDSGYFYLVSFYKDKYEISKQILDLTSYKKPEYTMLIQYLKEHDEFDPASKMPSIQFEKNSPKVPEGLWSDLEPIVKMMQEVPQLKMKIYGLGSADEDYPMELSITRARLVADMMMEVGIKPGRIRINGVGSFRPRSGCVEGKQCTQEQYKMDRVVMYKVIKD